MAYANSDINGGGGGCVIWLDHLIDIRQFLDGGQDLYIRMRDPKLGMNLIYDYCLICFNILFTLVAFSLSFILFLLDLKSNFGIIICSKKKKTQKSPGK